MISICFSMEANDKKRWALFKENVTTKLNKPHFKLLCELHSKYFKHTYYEPCTCTPNTVKQWINQLNDLYEKDNNNQQT